MGYIFLFIALIAGTVKGYCGKKTSGYTNTCESAVFANFIRMILCVIIGVFVVIISGNISFIKLDTTCLLISLLSGISTSVFVVSWLLSVRKSAYMMVDIFLTFGVIVPLVLSGMFFDEIVKISQWIGLLIVIAGVLIMCSYNNNVKGKINLSSFILLFISGLSSGITDFSQKLFIKKSVGIPIAVFNLYTYVFSAIGLLITYLIFRKKSYNDAEKVKYSKKMFAYIFVMSACLFAHSYFKTMSAGYLDAVQLYPLSQGGALMLSTAMSAVMFKEKITLKSVVGTVMAFLGLIAINIL